MNVVFLSPHFPPNFENFCIRLKEAGAQVLGLADSEFSALTPELRHSLSEYYRVSDMHNYDELVRAMGYFTHRHGKLGRLDSQNEYWLETEARLRTDFNIPGIKVEQIPQIKRKSQMKELFLRCGLTPARGRVCKNEAEIKELAKEIGYPLVAKPDIGVGAAKTYKIDGEQDIERYLQDKLPTDYIIEEFIDAQILTYDGLTDKNGEIVYSSSLRYSKGVMEAVNEDTDLYYYLVREIEPDLEDAGLKTVKAFDVRERFFHFEYFLHQGQLIPLEVNMRPPGGLTLDMMNYQFDFDCYRLWADLLVKGDVRHDHERKHFVIYVGRKNRIHYAISHEQAVKQFDLLTVRHESISGVFAQALGNYGYILRSLELEPLIQAANAIQERAQG